jgi:hypothetical protein
MREDLVRVVEQDLKEVVEAEIQRFRDKFVECKQVDTIYLNEDFNVGIYGIELYGWRCNHYLNMFITRDTIYEFPELSCFLEFEDKEHNFKRDLAYVKLIFTPIPNRCYVKAEIHETELRETAEHIVKVAWLEEGGNDEN